MTLRVLPRCGSTWRRDAFVASLLFLLTVGPRTAQARTTIVPDQFPKIQAALDAVGWSFPAETLLVRGGDYPEQVLVSGNFVVIGIPPVSGPSRPPRIQALEAGRGEGGEYYEFKGIHFEGTVVVGATNGPDALGFVDCHFEGGLRTYDTSNYPEASHIVLKRCSWNGPVHLRFFEATLDSCVAYAPVLLPSEYRSVVRNCRFEVGSGTAVTLSIGGVLFASNLVRGGGGGLVVRNPDYNDVLVYGNRFEGCGGTAIDVSGNSTSLRTYVERNRILDCGGDGVVVRGPSTVRDNEVIGCGGAGMRLTQDEEPGAVEGNVVGRCGSGMAVSDGGRGPTFWSVQRNTVYECSGAGIEIQSGNGATFANNLVVRNLGVGLSFVGAVPPLLYCNDWFGNGAGGTPPSDRDLALDPLFCDVAADVVTLRSDSPLLDATDCGRIGARGAGCEPVRSLGLRIASPILRSNGALLVTFTLPAAAAARLELMDLAGRRLRSREIGTLGPGEHSLDLAEGGSLPSGIYFVRILQGDQSARARAVFIR